MRPQSCPTPPTPCFAFWPWDGHSFTGSLLLQSVHLWLRLWSTKGLEPKSMNQINSPLLPSSSPSQAFCSTDKEEDQLSPAKEGGAQSTPKSWHRRVLPKLYKSRWQDRHAQVLKPVSSQPAVSRCHEGFVNLW